MRESSYIRLALMFGDNNASTFAKNLEKMIALVLYDKYGEQLSVVSIIERLKINYGLDFSEVEILSVIQGKKQNRIIRVSENKDHSLDTYSITPDEKARIDSKIENTMLKDVIARFLDENQEVHTTAENFESVLKRYFYSVFNSNATTISELLDKQKSSELKTDVEFTEEEKSQINCFLEWNNTDKDKFVYQMVSCCFDYCMMTVKHDKNIYRVIFRQKKFYLDTNIIFRMMGLNRENRKKLIDTFIRKCKDSGIVLLYTNHTRQELENTIDNRVEQIKELLQQKEPISVDSVRLMTSKYYNLSFYEAYAKWCEERTNRIGDYVSFTKELKYQASKICSEFTRINFDNYQYKNPDEFEKYCIALKGYKEKKRRYARDEVVQTDVNNYMFIRSQNENDNASDFFSTHNYLISADHILGDWAREQCPSAVPIVVLPSVWYSLILQYTGRADDDFASFTRFLNFSLETYDEEDPRKVAILKKVIALDEPKEIKERTIFDIEDKLSTDYIDFDSIDDIVENSHEYILDQERARIKDEIQREADRKVEEFKKDTITDFERRLQDKDNENSQEKTRHLKEELELEEKNKELLGRIDEAHKQGARERAEKLADAALTKTMIRYWLITLIFVVTILGLAMYIIIKANDKELSWLPSILKESSVVFDLIIGIIIFILDALIFSKGLCKLDKKAVRERLVEKYLK